MTSTTCGGRTPKSSTSLRRVTPVVGKTGQGESGARLGPGDADGLALGEGDGLSRGWQSSVDRRTSEMLPSIWANLMTSSR